MCVRIKVAVAGIRRGREANSVGGGDGGGAIRIECALRVCARARGRKFSRVECVGKNLSIVGTRERDGGIVVPCNAIL